MSPRKLTETDKQEILDLYHQPQETTSTLAERFQVSSSTISRFLKSRLNEQDYEDLIQQKRLSRTPTGAANVIRQYTEQAADEPEADLPTSTSRKPRKLQSSRSTQLTIPDPEPAKLIELVATSSTEKPIRRNATVVTSAPDPISDDEDESLDPFQTLLDDQDLEPELDDDEFDDDDDWDDEDDDDEDEPRPQPQPRSANGVEVLPLSRATFPRTCYLVVDRTSELITRPLHEFGDLGSIPSDETSQRTLPIFDNHRVARRFSQQRSHRVIKVPDSNLFEKTRSYLYAKGITRILLDGQVYFL
ncbi:hypothetical protein PN441_03495 [Spirulina major CS-329]|uniref:hypothetical protein n=1 Tax=Spirulina TaxID=1154 RepID=UPI00232B30D7|nr:MULTISPECIES: hypothetical protein [Spirulina]MDB9494699.1 hypothetical protein [Spirulina subsalsa CS-330]MDB9502122.1 hypothetical protein [Spirulina major CS-329]